MLPLCLLRDEMTIRRNLKQRMRPDAFAKKIEGWEKRALNSAETVEKRTNNKTKVEYPKELPVSQQADKICEAIRENQVVIVCGDTGSGKTTQLPKMLYDLGYGIRGRIGCTQPRRLAATAMARRVSDELKGTFGKQVGCQVRFSDEYSDETSIKFMTDGILLAESSHDRNWLQYDALIIDEAHERSLNIDFILGYIKNLLPKRPDLKIVISSATLDAERFSAFFDNAPVIEVEGRRYPVEDFYLPPAEEFDDDVARQVASGIEWINDVDQTGDILVFLPGEREIRDTAEVLEGRKWNNTEILPLYGRLSMADQQRVFRVGGRRRIVLATNVAETSVTIPGIMYVVDSGLVRLSRYNPRMQIERLQIEQISQASANQRRGRCGRIAPGICIRLYSKEVFENSEPFTPPESVRSSLADVILKMKTLNLPELDEFPFIDTPQKQLISEGYRTLFEIGALSKDRNLTELGRQISAFPIEPRIARMIVASQNENVLPEMLILAAALSIQDVRERPADKQAEADAVHKQWKNEISDFISLLNIWRDVNAMRDEGASHSKMRRWCTKNFVSFKRLLEWQNLWRELRDTASGFGWKEAKRAADLEQLHPDLLHRAILAGIPLNIGVRQEDKSYKGSRGRQFYIFPGSNLPKQKSPEWVMSFALVETTRLFARMNAAVNSAWLEEIAPHLITYSYSGVHWNEKQGYVYALESVSAGGMNIASGRRVHFGKIDLPTARDIFIKEGMVQGRLFAKGRWLKEYRRLQQEIEVMEQKIRRPHSLFDGQAAYEFFDKNLPADICNTKDLDKWTFKNRNALDIKIDDILAYHSEPITEDLFPEHIEMGGIDFPLNYQFAPGEEVDGVSLRCHPEELTKLPDYTLDWVVPAWLHEKVQLLLKSLEKNLRSRFQPLLQTTNEFLKWLNENPSKREQSLTRALSEFCRGRSGEIIGPADFDETRLPDHLKMKIQLIDDHGKILCTETEWQEALKKRGKTGTKTSADLSAWRKSGMTECIFATLPEVVSSGEGVVYPALTDEVTAAGLDVFLTKENADFSHRRGLFRLFALAVPHSVNHLKKKPPFSIESKMHIMVLGDYLVSDFLVAAVAVALKEPPRCREDFELRRENARAELYADAEKLAEKLDRAFQLYGEVESEIETLRNRPAYTEIVADLERQLDELFWPGALQDPNYADELVRYLRGMKKRMERARNSAGKDFTKLHPLLPLAERIHTILEDADAYRGDLHRLLRMWQEFRMQTFAPEIGVKEKLNETVILDKIAEMEAVI